MVREQPPSYHEGTGRRFASEEDEPTPDFTTRATNFVSIDERKSIRENYTINTSLQPIHLNFDLGTIPACRNEDHHLELRSNGYIQTKIRLVGGNRETAILVLETKGGNLDASVVTRGQQEFVLRAKSNEGSLRIRIPRDFDGPIMYTGSPGKRVWFSDEMKKDIMPLRSSQGNGLVFLGRWRAPRNHDQKHAGVDDWTGDKVIAESREGTISFSFSDEGGGSCVIQ